MNKAEFLMLLRSKRAGLEENLARLSAKILVTRSTPDSWSIKDALAHLTYYEQHMLNNVRQSMENGTEISGVTLEEQTTRNAQIFANNWDKPLAEVLTEMRGSFAQVTAYVETIPEDILLDPDHFAWLNGMPLWQYILDETSGEHYEEHLGSLMEQSKKYYRFVCGDEGIYAVVESDCPRDDPRRKTKPDGAWLPKVGPDYPGAISFWTEFGLQKYLESGLFQWHRSVVNDSVQVIVCAQLETIFYSDEYQVICPPQAVVQQKVFLVEEFLQKRNV